jgi:hypothetical protein
VSRLTEKGGLESLDRTKVLVAKANTHTISVVSVGTLSLSPGLVQRNEVSEACRCTAN